MIRERYRGALLGLAAGDALGTTLEFKPPGIMEEKGTIQLGIAVKQVKSILNKEVRVYLDHALGVRSSRGNRTAPADWFLQAVHAKANTGSWDHWAHDPRLKSD
jgi:hypothetical protein